MAQLALNALKTAVVEPEQTQADMTITANGATVDISGKVNYKVTASQERYASTINNVESNGNALNGVQGFVIELGEKLYEGKLQLTDTGVYDDFGRPSRRWQYDGKNFGTYPKVEDLRKEYTAKVTGKDLYEELGSDIIDSIKDGRSGDYRLRVTIDGYAVEGNRTLLAGAYFTEGSMVRTNTDKVGDTGKGVLTQVFVDSVNHRVDIAIINTYLAKATQNYVSKDDEVKLKVYELENIRGGYVKTDDEDVDIIVEGDDLDIADVKKDDLFLVTVSQGEVMSMVKPEIVADTTINSFKVDSWVKNSDVQYDYADTAQYDEEVLNQFDDNNMKNLTYNIILDQYGYMIGIEQNESVNQYVFLAGMELGSSNLSAKNAQANVIFLDGTMATVTVNIEKSRPLVKVDGDGNPDSTGDITSLEGGDWTYASTHTPDTRKYSQLNTWCTYSVDDNNVYTLNEVGPDSGVGRNEPVTVRKVAQKSMDLGTNKEINTKNYTLDGNTGVDYAQVYGNDETVYINVSLKNIQDKVPSYVQIINKVESTTVGIKNVDMTVKDIDDVVAGGNTYLKPTKGEIYTLYNKDGYIIAALVMGADDNGASANYAYIVGPVKQEDDLGGSKYGWSQEAIVNGKKVTLTEIGDKLDCLDLTKKGKWYELSYDKDGNVNSIKSNPKVSTNDPQINFGVDNDHYLNDVKEIPDALNGVGAYGTNKTDTKNLLLYADYHTTSKRAGLHYEKGTLYTNWKSTDLTPSASHDGIYISPNVKVVVCLSSAYDTDGSKAFDQVIDTYEGREGLEQALADLNSEKNDFYGYLSAIIEGKNGATTLILDDRSGRIQGNLEPFKTVTVNVTLVDENNATIGSKVVTLTSDRQIVAGDLTSAVPTGYSYDAVKGIDQPASYTEGQTYNNVVAHYKATGAMQVMLVVKNGSDVVTSKIVNISDVDEDGVLTIGANGATGVDYALPADLFDSAAYTITSMPAPQFFNAGQRATVEIAVAPITVSSIALESAPSDMDVLYNTDLTANALLEAGMKVKATLSTGDTETIDKNSEAAKKALVSISGTNIGEVKANHDSETVTVSYGGKDKTASINIKVYANLKVEFAGTLAGMVEDEWTIVNPGKIKLNTAVTVSATQKAAADITLNGSTIGIVGGTDNSSTVTGTTGVQASNTVGVVSASVNVSALSADEVTVTITGA